jgi:hypothetical protein
MQHIAINEALDGKGVDWMEHVSDRHYRRGPAAAAPALTAGKQHPMRATFKARQAVTP